MGRAAGVASESRNLHLRHRDATRGCPRSSLGTALDSTTAAAPLFTLEIPFERVATLRPGNTPPPYPEEARGLGVGTTVLLTFVVDEDGRAQGETIRVLPSRTPGSVVEARLRHAFERSAKLAVQRYQYSPAQIFGCRVKMWVQQPFAFEIQP